MELVAWGEVISPSPDTTKNGLHDHGLGQSHLFSTTYEMPLLDKERQKGE